MLTVVDQVNPWLTPRRTLASITQPQDGAPTIRSGTGRPTSQPATSTGLRPRRSARAAAPTVVTPLVKPKAAVKGSAALTAARPHTFLARSRRAARFRPSLPPTTALAAT